MARRKSGGGIAALAAKAVEEVKRGRPVGSKNRRKTKSRGTQPKCTDISEIKRAVETIKKVKGYLKEMDSVGVIGKHNVLTTSSTVGKKRGRPRK